MKKIKKILGLVLAVCVIASLSFAAFAAEPMYDTDNDLVIPDATHLDVKADAKYIAEIDGEQVTLNARLVPESIVVTVRTIGGDINYRFADYHVFNEHERGMDEYRIILDSTDGAALNLIIWDGVSFRMKNVYISARFVFDDVPEALQDSMVGMEDGRFYLDVEDYRYTGIQECTSHNGLRSEGNAGYILGVDLYITASGLSVETETTESETTEPETTEPETTEPETTEPETTEPETTEPETTEPETTEPETTEPETTEPEATKPETEATKPETEATKATEATKPETTEPKADAVPDTGDHSNNPLLVVLMSVSAIGMVAALVLGHKMNYTGKWE